MYIYILPVVWCLRSLRRVDMLAWWQGVYENCLFMKEVGDGGTARAAIFERFERATLPSDPSLSAAEVCE